MTFPYWGEYGYEFVQDLIKAIESYTDKIERKNIKEFTLNGIQLKYAVERVLYFTCSVSSPLIELYNDLKSNKNKDTYIFSDEIEYFIALEFIRGLNKTSKCKLTLNRPGYFQLFKLKVIYILRKLKPHKKNKFPLETKLVVYVLHEKFINYFSSILKNYPGQSAYLCLHELNNQYKVFANTSFEVLHYINWSYQELYNDTLLSKFPRIIMLTKALLKLFDKGKPQVVILPEGNAPDYEVVNQVCRHYDIPVICIQNGWAPFIHNGFRNMSYTKMLLWGHQFTKMLEPYNPQQKFVVTGSHLVTKRNMEKESHQVNGKGIVFFLQAPKTQLISNECWDNMLSLASWVAYNFTQIKIYVREHPQHAISLDEKSLLKKQSNIIFAQSTEYSLDELLKLSYVSVSVYSSTILESIAAGVIPLIYNETPMPTYFPDVHAAKAGIEVKSLSAAKDILNKLILDPGYIESYREPMMKFADNYFQNGKEKALNNIIDEISKTVL